MIHFTADIQNDNDTYDRVNSVLTCSRSSNNSKGINTRNHEDDSNTNTRNQKYIVENTNAC